MVVGTESADYAVSPSESFVCSATFVGSLKGRVPMKVLVSVLFVMVTFVPTSLLAGNLTVTDVKELAGSWEGFLRADYNQQTAVRWTVREDGTFTSVGQSVSEGKIKLVDGRLMYETTLSKGTLSLEDRRGKQILNVVGTTDRSAQDFAVEMIRKQ